MLKIIHYYNGIILNPVCWKKGITPDIIRRAFESLKKDENAIVEYDGYEYYYEYKEDLKKGRIVVSPIEQPDYIYRTTIEDAINCCIASITER